MKSLKSILLAVIFMAATSNIAFAQTAPVTATATTTPETTISTVAKAAKTETIKVKVKGIGCSVDIKTIATNVEKLEGVISCKPSKKGPTTTYKVEMDPTVTSKEKIHAAIENTGGCENSNDRPYKVKL